MLKGIVIAVSGAELLKETLTREALPWSEPEHLEPVDFLKAVDQLKADKPEVLCLVETDREERIALELGLFCVGYLNPSLPGERLSGCRILRAFRRLIGVFFKISIPGPWDFRYS